MMGQPPQVFISYSHQDKEWLERLKVHLKPLVRSGLEVWDDTRIQAGGDWRGEIETALAAARVAVLLISPDFLASDFIAEIELPALLEAAEQRGTKILPLILYSSLFADTQLARYQSVNGPTQPAVAPGTMTPSTAVRRTASAGHPTTATTTWAFAWQGVYDFALTPLVALE